MILTNSKNVMTLSCICGQSTCSSFFICMFSIYAWDFWCLQCIFLISDEYGCSERLVIIFLGGWRTRHVHVHCTVVAQQEWFGLCNCKFVSPRAQYSALKVLKMDVLGYRQKNLFHCNLIISVTGYCYCISKYDDL